MSDHDQHDMTIETPDFADDTTIVHAQCTCGWSRLGDVANIEQLATEHQQRMRTR